ncbi:MAG: DUF3520 domain-containing protein [bacterium]|nr:DUF3520 domain-containing protein [bacterium]
MRQPSEREIKDLLTPSETPKPPAGLAERIKGEIPEDFGLPAPPPTGHDNVVVGRFGAARQIRWLIAAGVVMAVGGGLLGYRLQQEVAPPELLTTPETTGAALPKQGAEPRGAIAEEPAPALEADRPPAPPAPAVAGEKAEWGASEVRVDPVSKERTVSKERAAETTAEEKSPVWVGTESGLDFRGGNGHDQGVQAQDAEVKERLRERLKSLPPAPLPDAEAPQRDAVSREKAGGVDAAGGRPSTPAPVEVTAVGETRRPPATERTTRDARREMKRRREEIQSLREMEEESGSLHRKLGYAEPTGTEAPAAVGASTGGTAEPNDAAYGDVFFQGYGTNPFVDTEDDRLSTFGLDVDTGSYTVVRRYLRDGHLPPADAVRVEELINYFDYGDPAPRRGDFAIHAEGAPSPFGEGGRYYLLRFNLHGREVAERRRPPAILTFVVDVSGSMRRENRLGLVKQALAMLLHQLRPSDRVALVVYGSQGRVLLDHTSDHDRIRWAIDELRPEGSTNAEEGLRLAYDLAAGQWRRGTINRVILCSDGVANVGRTSAESILSRIRRHAERGIELTTVGVGMGNYNDVLMERLADTGNGRYAYVDTLEEAQRIFVENLTGTLHTIAIEARAQVDFNPRVVARYRLLGYENRDIADERFRDDSVDAGEIGAGHTVTALYELKLHRKLERRDTLGTLHLRYGSFERSRMMELSRTVTGEDFARRWDDASPALRLTSLVAEFGEILKRSYWAKTGDLREVYERLRRVAAEFRGDREVADLVDLVGRAAGYRRAEEDEEPGWE